MKLKLAVIAKTALLSLVCSVLSACTTTFSQLDGRPFGLIDSTLYPVQVSKVDGRSYSGNPIWVEPGKRQITLLAPPEKYGRLGTEKTMEVMVGNCERIVFGARRPSYLRAAWEPEIVEREPLAGCKRKADALPQS
ncbi:MAG: hypothetical protein K1X48_11995 [Burkholderiaceae bacterium]|nr:hypothetical protein [Burkholderiaceae bacterium]